MYYSIVLKKIKIYYFVLILIAISMTGFFYYYSTTLMEVTSDKNNYTIVIDPGHGSIDTGAHHGNLYEKNVNLQLAFFLEKEINQAYLDPVLTRTEDKLFRDSRREDLRHRPQVAIENKADLFISIHANHFPTTQPSGSQIFYKPGCQESKKLAENIKKELQKLRPENDRSVNPGSYYVLNKTPVPAILIESGFLSNPTDRTLLQNQDYLIKMAVAIKDGVVNYLYDKVFHDIPVKKTSLIKPVSKSLMSVYYLKATEKDIILYEEKLNIPVEALLDEENKTLNFSEILILKAIEKLKETDDANLISPLPPGTNLKSFSVRDGKAVLDFSRELQQNFQGGPGMEQLTVKALTRTFLSIPEIDVLEILIEGQKNETIGGNIILSEYQK